MWIEWLEASLIILCMYFAYRGCYHDYITYTSEIPSRNNKRVTFKTKNDTKDEEDAGTLPIMQMQCASPPPILQL